MPFAVGRTTALAAVLALLAAFLLLPGCDRAEPPQKKEPGVAQHHPGTPAPAQSPTAEVITIDPMVVFEEPEADSPQEPAVPSQPVHQDDVRPTTAGTSRPRVAIIIDDMGHHLELGNQLMDLDLNLTFAFLPDAPFTAQQAAAAFAKGREILLHLPMEPGSTAWNPGKSALYVRDTPDLIREKMARMFAAVPQATGANNHMGSRFTTDGAAMRVVLATLKDRSFFFIDSYTARGSLGLAMARQLAVPAARRNIFLDNVHDIGTICRQIEELVVIAEKKGAAIAIGHPNRATLKALTECEERLRATVEIVNARQLAD